MVAIVPIDNRLSNLQRAFWERPLNQSLTFDAQLRYRKHAKGSVQEEYETGTVKQGQVFLEGTWLAYDADGYLVVHPGVLESAETKFTAALTVGQTLIMAGLTFTATVGGASVTQLATAWKDLTADAFTVLSPQTAGTGNATFTTGSTTVTFATAPGLKAGTALFGTSNIFIGILASDTVTTSGTLVANPLGAGTAYTTTVAAAFSYIAGDSATTVANGGFFTAGTLTDYTTQEAGSATDTVMFKAATAQTNATDVAATGTGTAPTITITQGSSTVTRPVGVATVTADATDGAIERYTYIIEGKYYAVDDRDADGNYRDWLKWDVPAGQQVLLADGVTLRTLTPYNTGLGGTSVAQQRARKAFVSSTEIQIETYYEEV